MERCREVAMGEGVRFAYIGNVPGHKAEHTYCHHCGEMVIRRYGYTIDSLMKRPGQCRSCKNDVPGIWTDPLKTSN